MPILLFLLVLAAVAGWSLAGRGPRFMRGLALLLDPPLRVERTFLDLVRGRQGLKGSLGGHRISARLQQSRQYQTGSLSLALETRAPVDAIIRRRTTWSAAAGQEPLAIDVDDVDAQVVRSWLTESSVRSAVDRLVVQRGMMLEIDRTFVRVTFRPSGWSLFVMFPGRFVQEEWQTVLDDLLVLAESLERLS